MRVCPNLAQFNGKDLNDFAQTATQFFIRPEDVTKYEDYVDVCCIYPAGTPVLYDVYAISKEWFGDLNEIIMNLDFSFDNRAVLPIFGEVRRFCGKRCLKGSGCSICYRSSDLATTLRENNYIFKPQNKD